jgi:hypothetical protein
MCSLKVLPSTWQQEQLLKKNDDYNVYVCAQLHQMLPVENSYRYCLRYGDNQVSMVITRATQTDMYAKIYDEAPLERRPLMQESICNSAHMTEPRCLSLCAVL